MLNYLKKNHVIWGIEVVEMPPVPVTHFFAKLSRDELGQFTAWLMLDEKGRNIRSVVTDGTATVMFDMVVASRHDNVRRGYMRYIKLRNIDPFVLRAARDTDPPISLGEPVASAQAPITAVATIGGAAPAAEPQLSINDLAKMIAELQAKMETMVVAPTNITNNNIQVNIFNFGEETMAHLSPPEVYRRLQAFDSVKRVLNETFFNPDMPQNHNVTHRSSRDGMVMVRSNNEWEARPFGEVANTMIAKGINYTFTEYKVTPENADSRETDALLTMMRREHHPKLRGEIRAGLLNRHDRMKKAHDAVGAQVEV